MEPPNGAPGDFDTFYWEAEFKNLFKGTGWNIESYSTAVRIEFFAPSYTNKYYAIMHYDYDCARWKYEIISDQIKVAYKSFADFVAVLKAMAAAKKIDKLNAINTAANYAAYITETFCDRGWDITRMTEHRIIINFFPKEVNKSYGRIYYDDAWTFTIYGDRAEYYVTFADFVEALHNL